MPDVLHIVVIFRDVDELFHQLDLVLGLPHQMNSVLILVDNASLRLCGQCGSPCRRASSVSHDGFNKLRNCTLQIPLARSGFLDVRKGENPGPSTNKWIQTPFALSQRSGFSEDASKFSERSLKIG